MESDTIPPDDPIKRHSLHDQQDRSEFSPRHQTYVYRACLHLILLIVHYSDIFLDLILFYLYQTDDSNQTKLFSYITLFLLMLPNILVILFSTTFEHLKKNSTFKKSTCEITKIACINLSHSQMFLCNVLWYYSLFLEKKRQKNQELNSNSHFLLDANKQIAQFDFLIIMGNMFHVLFNNIFSVIAHSLFYFSKNLLAIRIVRFQIVKIALSLLRISFTSSYFIAYFLSRELNVKLNQLFFILFRFLSNLFLVTVRLFSIVLIFMVFPKLGFLIICIKFVLSFLLVYFFVTSYRENSNVNYHSQSLRLSRFNSLRLFWTFFLGIFKLVSYFEDFSFKNCYGLLNLLLNLADSVLFVALIYWQFEAKIYYHFLYVFLFGVWSSFAIEIFYWKVIFKSKKAFLVKKIGIWFCDQTKLAINDIIHAEERLYSEEEQNVFI